MHNPVSAAFVPAPVTTTAPPPFLLDIFCRDSALTDACRAAGMASCGIGWFQEFSGSCKVQLNLALPWAQSLILDAIKCTQSVVTAWIAPPCGSLSKARNRPLAPALRRAGFSELPPLRSNDDLWGLPAALSVSKLAGKIFEANILIEFTFDLVRSALAQNKPWVVCNPKGSFLWDFPFWHAVPFFEVELHKCAFGGGRPAPVILRTSCQRLQSLGRKCDGRHQHRPWQPAFGLGLQQPSERATDTFLPKNFCKEAAEILVGTDAVSAAAPSGFPEVLLVAAKVQAACTDENRRKVALTSAAAGRQARGKRVDRLISEHKDTIKNSVPRAQALPLTKRRRLESPLVLGDSTIPKDAQIIANATWGDSPVDPAAACEVEFGLPWAPSEFIDIARNLKHPYATLAVSNDIAKAVALCATLGPSDMAVRRVAYIDKWVTRGIELLPEEAKFVAGLHDDVKCFAMNKRPLLFTEMLKDAGFPAADLCLSFLKQGVPMFGEMPTSGVFPSRPHAPTLSKADVMKAAKWALPATMGSKLKDPDSRAQRLLWEATEEEVRLGECRGPFSKEQMDSRFPSGWAAVPRFPVEQKSKVRPCDNYSIFGHNCTSSDSETIDTEGPDSIAGLAKLWTWVFEVDENFVFKLTLDDGTILSGTLHPELRGSDAQALLGRLIDLARAYKQLARDPVDADMAIFSLPFLTGGGTAFFEALALGFGARNAVKGFNLFARGLRHLIVVGLSCPTTHFFDDFTHVDPRPFAKDSCAAVEALFQLLGCKYKDSLEDLKPSCSLFAPLGVEFDFSTRGAAVIANTAKRKDKILLSIQELLDAPEVLPNVTQSLIGVCVFAESQTAGRSGSLVLRNLRKASSGSRERLNKALVELREHILATSPRIVNLRLSDRPVLLFTDAAADVHGATFGAVCIDPVSNTFEFFAGTFSKDQVKVWSDEVTSRFQAAAAQPASSSTRLADSVQRQIICQAELAVVPMALATWAKVVSNRDVFSFIDNDPAKDAFILGSSRSEWSAFAVRRTRTLCAELAAAVWYERVPSPSNIADWPSRGDVVSLLALGARRVAPAGVSDLPISFCDL